MVNRFEVLKHSGYLLLVKLVLAHRHALLSVFSMPVLGGGRIALVVLAVSGYGSFVFLAADLAVYTAIILLLRVLERR